MADAAAPSAAAPAAPAAPAPNASAPASEPAKAASSEPEKAPDPKESLDAHVAHAIKVAKRSAAAEKAKAPKAEKKAAHPKAEPAKAAAPEATPDDSGGDEPEAETGSASKSARELLEAGDLEGAFKAAFGKSPSEFNINSKRWAEFRKGTAKERAKLNEAYSAARNDIERREHQTRQLLREAREEVRPYQNMVEAKKLYAAGDVAAAVKLAFEDDASEFNKKILRQAHGKNPEVEALRNELAREREERAAKERAAAEQQAEHAAREQRQANFTWVRDNLGALSEPEYAEAAKRPRFVADVLRVLEDHYDEETNATLPLSQAAEMVLEAWREHFGASFGSSPGGDRGAQNREMSVRGGTIPARPEAKPSRTLSQTGAAEASAPTRGAHGLSLDEHVRMFSNGAAH